jgi:ATP synthase protein I
LVGASIVGAFFCSGAWTVGFAAARAPSMALLVALMTYTLQVVLLAVVFAALDRSGVLGGQDRRWLAATVIVGALAWTAALVAHALRSVPRVEEGGLEGAERASNERGVGW